MEAKAQPPVRALMNAMQIGETLSWPMERYDYVVNCRTRLQMASVKRFSSTTKAQDGQVTIERLEDAEPQQ